MSEKTTFITNVLNIARRCSTYCSTAENTSIKN